MINNIPDWLIFALLGALMSGLFGFLTKMKAEDESSDFYFFIIYSLVISIITFFLGNISINYLEFIIATVFGILTIITLKSRFASLKYINSSTYFINYRIFSSILITISGYLFFSEFLRLNDFIGIILGIITFILLIEKKEENEKIKDLKKGFILLFIGIIIISISNILQKYIAIKDLNLFGILFYQGIISIILIFILKIKKIKKEIKKVPKIKNIILYIFLGLFSLSSLFVVKAFETGTTIVVYKVLSYSIFITIFLSMIFYREKISIKKILAFILAIISIGFFL